MYVYFNISEMILLEVLEGKTPDEKRNPSLPFYIGLANEKGHSREGVIDYIDNTVDTATGTIKVRGKLPNDKDPIFPGMFVRIRVPASVKSDAILVHEKAIGTDIAGKYLQIIGKDNIVEQRLIEMGILVDDMRVIEEGISAEEVYIVDGTQQARPGLPVNTEWIEKTKKEKDDTKKTKAGG
jgi:RND family efflux transporter MFP subunit